MNSPPSRRIRNNIITLLQLNGRDAECIPAVSACQKSLAEFAARRRQRNKIIFSRDMCVRENTSQAASVEFVRHGRTNYARSRLQTFCRKNPEGFSTVSNGRDAECIPAV